MRQEYYKLIRDLIPQQIESSSKQCAVEEMVDFEFRQSLREKLVAEVRRE